MIHELREGWTEFRARRWVWVVLLGFGVLNAIQAGCFNVLGPVIADETFGRGRLGFVLATQSAGLVAGTVLMFRYRPRRPMVAGMVAMFAMTPLLFVLGVEPQLVLLLPCALLAGSGMDVFGISWDTALQTQIPPGKLSRVYSYDALGSYIAIPVGQVIIGPLATQFGTREVVGFGAVVDAVVTLLVLADRSVRGLERVEHEPDIPGDEAPAVDASQ